MAFHSHHVSQRDLQAIVTKAFQQVHGMKPLRAATTRPKHRIASNQKALPRSTSHRNAAEVVVAGRIEFNSNNNSGSGESLELFFCLKARKQDHGLHQTFFGWLGDEKTKVWTGKYSGFAMNQNPNADVANSHYFQFSKKLMKVIFETTKKKERI